ncbi:MAG: hypothetical protein IJC85_00595 [Oscillospiraceae bacterium]|nr:hypothetical protein [Oscillospiraceae bacterium]
MEQKQKNNRTFGVLFVMVISLVLIINMLYNGGIRLVESFDPHQDAMVESGKNTDEISAQQKFKNELFLNQAAADALSELRRIPGGDFVFVDGINDIYRDTTGRLTYVCRYREMESEAASLTAFSKQLASLGVPMLYAQLPFKILQGENTLVYNVGDYSNANADRLIKKIARNGVDTFDLRDVLKETDRQVSPLFFVTDSRWQVGTAFDAYLSVLTLVDREYHLCHETAERFGSDTNFALNRTEQVFLGNQGSKVGVGLVESIDAFDTIVPYARTSFLIETRRADGSVLQRSGDWSGAIMVKPTSEMNLFDTYLGADAPIIRITNQNIASKERIMIIGDDFVNPFAAFFSLNVQQTMVVNPDLYTGSVLELVSKFSPDLVLVMYNPKSFENEEFFHFS